MVGDPRLLAELDGTSDRQVIKGGSYPLHPVTSSSDIVQTTSVNLPRHHTAPWIGAPNTDIRSGPSGRAPF